MADIEEIFCDIDELRTFDDAKQAVAYAHEIYQRHADKIKAAFAKLLEQDEQSAADFIAPKGTTYPFLGVDVPADRLNSDPRLSYGAVHEPGAYGGTLTRFDIFSDYYEQQIERLIEYHGCPVVVGASQQEIPLPFIVDHTLAKLSSKQLWQLKSGFALPNLSRVNDEVPNCTHEPDKPYRPISLFSAERVEYSLHRLQHYTATDVKHFQSFVLLTNYQRYINAFINYSHEMLLKYPDEYTELISPGNCCVRNVDGEIRQIDGVEPAHLPQMPTYHLKRADGQGITFINIGVGPSNAKNITDHLAVLRPHCWIMLGHCAGLRQNQKLGDYVLAHGYVREDNVMNRDLPPWVPVPPIAEVQVALQNAVGTVLHQEGAEVKLAMRTGTVVTTDDRNWELRTKEMYQQFRQSRAIALDMESATIAANGFRFRVPYGTLLCVSDKPIQGQIKLSGMANDFYRQKVSQHLQVGLEAINILRSQGVEQLHSRKLRGFDEPPFR